MQPPKYEDIYSFANLLNAAKKTIKGRWRKRRKQALFRIDMEKELLSIQQTLISKTYQPQNYQTFIVEDPKKRVISAASIHDRIVHHAVINVIGAWLERSFIEHSYACRKNKGTHRAIEYAQICTRRYKYFAHFDVVKFFDSIDRNILKNILEKRIPDREITHLLDVIIDQAPGISPGKSVPIGNLTSQYFGNLYLDKVDHFIKDHLGIKGYVRYMDNILIFHDAKDHLQDISRILRHFVSSNLQLQLTTEGVCPVFSGVCFLGQAIYPKMRRIQKGRWLRFTKKFQKLQQNFMSNSISENQFLHATHSMVEYLKTANSYRIRKKFFAQKAIEF